MVNIHISPLPLSPWWLPPGPGWPPLLPLLSSPFNPLCPADRVIETQIKSWNSLTENSPETSKLRITSLLPSHSLSNPGLLTSSIPGRLPQTMPPQSLCPTAPYRTAWAFCSSFLRAKSQLPYPLTTGMLQSPAKVTLPPTEVETPHISSAVTHQLQCSSKIVHIDIYRLCIYTHNTTVLSYCFM
jgi:hypothetical protein